MQFGLLYFSSGQDDFSKDKYRLVFEGAKFADRHGFSSVWIPERHFTNAGCLYPNPSVLHAALARETTRICLRAGSVVLPLHNPIRVAEEWAVVDNLSGGRVGIAFASGWHSGDFVFFPEKYANRHEEMYRGIEIVQKLWQGGSILARGGDGNQHEIKIYPSPIQPQLPIWITAAGNPKTFSKAGEIGANLLTHMFNQSIKEAAEKIALYRKSRADHGYDPKTGQVTVMLHTFIGSSDDIAREQVRKPFCEYLKSSLDLVREIAASRGQSIDLAGLTPKSVDDFVNFVFERLLSERVLFGTPASCFEFVKELKAIGVDEIACQLDFGVDVDLALESLPYINQLKELCEAKLDGEDSARFDQIGVSAETVSAAYIPKPELSLSQLRPLSEKRSPIEEIQARCRKEVSSPEFYGRLSEHGIHYPSSFQLIERLWQREGEALGQLQLAETLEQEVSLYNIHPALLDACFQVLMATLPASGAGSERSFYLPAGLQSFQLQSRSCMPVWGHAILHSGTNTGETLDGDVRLLNSEGEIVAEASGLRLKLTDSMHAPQQGVWKDLSGSLYELRWELKENPKKRQVSERALPSHGSSDRRRLFGRIDPPNESGSGISSSANRLGIRHGI